MQGFDRIPDSVGHLVMKEDGAVTAVSKYSVRCLAMNEDSAY